MKRLLWGILAGFPFFATGAEPLAIGADAPRITAIDQDGQPLDLGHLYDEGSVLVYFYPRADTPGCTAQACSLRDAFETLSERGIQVIGVSTDTPADQRAFKDKHELPFTLISDSDEAVARAFGVPVRGSFASRQAFLINRGTIVWRDLSASTDKQAADVLAAVDELSG